MANWKKLASGAAGAAGAGGGLNVEDVFSTTLYDGNQTARTITNGINLSNNVKSPISSPQNGTGLVYFGGYYYYANSSGYVYRTDDVATTATAVQTGSGVSRLAAGSTYIYSATSGNFYYSTNGTSWTQTQNKPIGSYNLTADCMAEFGGTWYVVLQHPIFGNNGVLSYSSNQGASWTDNTSAPFYQSTVKFLTVVNSRMYAATTGGALYYTTNGTSWTTCSGAVAPNQIAYVGSNYVAAGNDGKIYYSSNGQSFTATGILTGLTGTTAVQTVASDGTTAYAVGYGTSSGGYYYTSTNGSSWTQTSTATLGKGDGTSGFTVLTSDYFVHKMGALDLDGTSEGGLTWITPRTTGAEHQFIDSERGVGPSTPVLISSMSNGQINRTGAVTVYNSDGFDLGTYDATNYSGRKMVAWTFRKAPKFFDVVTYSSNQSSSQTINHNLGSVPGCIIVKKTSGSGGWAVYHRGNDATNPENYFARLDSTGVLNGNSSAFGSAPTSTTFTVGNNGLTNDSDPADYVAYLFAHNDGDGDFGPTGDQDIIKCGSYSGNGSNDGPAIDLGFEPQWFLVFNITEGGPWILVDNMRSGKAYRAGNLTDNSYLQPNSVAAELVNQADAGFTPEGFTVSGGSFSNDSAGVGNKYIYIAIRRGPMAVPTDANDVFDIFQNTSSFTTPAWQNDILVDMGIYKRTDSAESWWISSRLTAEKALRTDTDDYELNDGSADFDFQTGWGNYNASNTSYYSFAWKRAPNFFDAVGYKGTGTANHTVKHNLGVVPEMIWLKDREDEQSWIVYHKDIGNSEVLLLNSSIAPFDSNNFNDQTPTATEFYLGGPNTFGNYTNNNIAFLFASLDGVSKVGSYTGNGTNQNIDCGFSNTARFVLVKPQSTSGNWQVAGDFVNGIVAGSDSLLRLDLNNAVVNFDFIDPYSGGFNVTGAQLNTNGTDYIFYAIA